MATLSEIWAEIVESALWQQLAGERYIVAVAVVLLLWLLAWYVGWLQKRRRAKVMLLAVNDAIFGRSIPRSRMGAWGFAVSIEPPPERFREFNISYQPVSIFDPVDLLRMWLGGKRNRLLISGLLASAPTAEIIWVRGQAPGRALGTTPGRAPWVHARLDFAGAEYATRGTNVAAIKHVLQDLYARFSPSIRSIVVQREQRPQMQMVVTGRIEPRDVSPLITSARAIGRAALLE